MPQSNEQKINEYAQVKTVYRPIFFDFKKNEDAEKFSTLLDSGKVVRVSDDYEEQIRELFSIENPDKIFLPNFPELFAEYLAGISKNSPLSTHGMWVYYPWNGTVVHILDDDAFQKVRMARNKYLITEEEQKKFYDAVIGFAGLSVGWSIVLAVVLEGGAKHIKLADNDRLALSNMNRILAGSTDFGSLKTEMAARRIYEINPYAEVELFSDGITDENIGRFFGGLTLVVDEIDNLAMKWGLREHARDKKIPLVMATDNEERGVVDVERYDITPDQIFFNGRLGGITLENLKGLSKIETGQMIGKMVGEENATDKMRKSLGEIGKTIVSWPQLGGTAMVNGGAAAYVIRQIIYGEGIQSGRIMIPIDMIADEQKQ
jgi:hypothetical protein